MKAILIGGPDHLRELNPAPTAPAILVAVPVPKYPPEPLAVSDEPIYELFKTVRYERSPVPIGGYWLYVADPT